MTFVEQAMDAAGASSKMRAIITNAIGMTGENQMYTTKHSGTALAAVPSSTIPWWKRHGRTARRSFALTAEGMPHERGCRAVCKRMKISRRDF